MAIDRVLLRSLRLDASIGVLDWEHEKKQPLEVDVDAFVDTAELLRTGDLRAGADFTQVVQAIVDVVGSQHFELVEVLADRLAHEVLKRTAAVRVRVQVRKYSVYVSAGAYVGVEVVRERESAVVIKAPETGR